MSIHKRQTKNGIKYDVKLRRPDNTQYQRSFKTKKEAEAFAAKELADRERGTWLDDRSSDVTFADIATRWLEGNITKRANTRQRDKGILNKHILPVLGARKVRTITRSDIAALFATWVKQGLAPATIRRHRAILSAIFNSAVADDILHKSPTYKVSTPRVDVKPGRALSDEEARRLLGATPEHYFALVYFFLTTGIRWSEAAGLQIKHFKPLISPPTLTIEQGAHETRHGRVIEETKSSASRREIVLSQHQLDVLAQHLKKSGRTAIDGEQPLFISPSGKPLAYANFRNRVWMPLVKAAELDGLQIRDLRKTAATNLFKAGVDVRTAIAIMGHADIRTTVAHYAQATVPQRLQAAQVLAQSVLPDAETVAINWADSQVLR